jgi:hypothetical protein
MDSISIREAARRLGVHHAAVQKRVKAGTLAALPDGRLDWATVQQQWTRNRDESKVRKPLLAAPTHAYSEPSPVSRFTTSERTFADAKTKREYIRLEREALQLKRFKGELAPIGEINAWVAGQIIRAREILMRIGPELKDRLAQTSNPHECERLVNYEISRALNELSEFRPSAQ